MSKKKKKPIRYFFYKGDLHKKIKIFRARDLIVAWHYKSGKPMKYSYVDVRKHGKKAFTTKEVGKLINRSRQSIDNAMNSGFFHRPEKTYGLDENRNEFQYLWSEDNIMDLHEYFLNTHVGRPRKDGEINPGRGLPPARELRAMLRDKKQYYVEVDGEFVPAWDADGL